MGNNPTWAASPSGKARVCKTLILGSIPSAASRKSEFKKKLLFILICLYPASIINTIEMLCLSYFDRENYQKMLPKKHILMVDDEPEHCLLVSRALKSAGFSITMVYDGSRGIELINHKKFDLYLLDIRL